eukprot:scaffold10922_cov147-Cylindrotheca_fusiformis.AAC.6
MIMDTWILVSVSILRCILVSDGTIETPSKNNLWLAAAGILCLGFRQKKNTTALRSDAIND